MKLLVWFRRLLSFIVLFFLIDFGISQVLLIGVNKYFGLNSDSDILLNGSSMTLAGFDKRIIENSLHKKVAFYSRNGVSLADRNAMLHHFYSNNTKKTALTVLEVNPLLFSKKVTAENVYMLFLPFMDDSSMNDLIRKNTDFKEYFTRKYIRCSRFNTDLISLSIKGFLGVYDNKKSQQLDDKVLEGLRSKENMVPVDFDLKKVMLFNETIKLATANSNKVVLVNMPIFSTKMKTFKKSEYDVFLSFIKQFSRDNKNVVFLDLNQLEITNNPKLFSDPLHLNSNGQTKATELLIDCINLKE